MVARTPPKHKKMLTAMNPVLIRETLNKVDRCMARLQELQYTVAGGNKVVLGVSLSPRSTRGYLRTSIRCKQESVRIKNGATRRSPVGKFPFPANTGEWRRMSLPAMLVGETVGEILQAIQFAREIVSAVAGKTATEDPRTPMSQWTNHKEEPQPEKTKLKARRKKEKQTKLQHDDTPPLKRARSRRINFKVSPPKGREFGEDSYRYLANRVSPRNRPWARKTVLFPNPLFLSSQQQQFCKARSPPIKSKDRGTPHKFLIKSPPSTSKFQVKIKSPLVVSISPTSPTSLSRSSPKRAAASKFSVHHPPTVPISPTRPSNLSRSSPKRSAASKFNVYHPPTVSISPTRLAGLSRNSPKRSVASKFRRSFSPSRLATKLVSISSPGRSTYMSKGSPKRSAASKFHLYHPTTVSISSPTRPTSVSRFSPKRPAASKFRRSFSPSRLVTRLALPLKSKKTAQRCDGV